jgi:glycine/D-amino acid oxidase-like deaminating enzyme
MDHVIVIGAGVIGASVALHLAQAGVRVTVMDAGGVAGQASGRSFGWINASFFADADHFRLREAGMAAHRALAADLGLDLIDWAGCLWWEKQGVAFDKQAQALSALGYPVRELKRSDVAALEPALQGVPDRVLHCPGEGAVDAAALAEAMLTAACAKGARVWLGCKVENLARKDGAICGVATPYGVIDADQVVVAAGTATQALLEGIDVTVPMVPRPGLLMQTRPLDPLIRHVMVSPAGEFRQDSEGRVWMPTAASHQGDASARIEKRPDVLADAALARLQANLPQVRTWDRVTAAMRPVPQDGLPVIGPVAPGAYVTVLHSGVTLAAITGRLAAQEVLGRQADPLLRPYRPSRFS